MRFYRTLSDRRASIVGKAPRQFGTGRPCAVCGATLSRYNRSRYWQVTMTLTSNIGRALDAQVQCTFLNGGRSVGDAYFGPTLVAPGEQIVTDMIGPPTTVYVDSTTCRMVGQ